MNVKKQIDYWLATAKSDLETAEVIFRAGKNYHHCLFFCRLVLEKGLKALVVKKTRKIPPKIHNLLLLADMSDALVDDAQKDFFRLMNGFDIEGRYPDEQYEIYMKATKRYTMDLLAKTKEQFRWMGKLALRLE
jgi:HEPN domain-containing protein